MIIEKDEIDKVKKSWQGKRIGLVTGCFDVIHFGHISLLEFAKSHVDLLLVGVDSDRSIQLNKGKSHPYFNQEVRLKVVDSIKFVDYTFLIDHKLEYCSEKSSQFYINLYKKIGITYLITNKQGDSTYKKKEELASILGINFILQNEEKFSNSSKIISDVNIKTDNS